MDSLQPGGAPVRTARSAARIEIGEGSPETGTPSHPVTISAGCARLAPSDEGNAAQLLAAADVALNMAKRAGRNRVVSAGI